MASPAASAAGAIPAPNQNKTRAMSLVRYLAAGACNVIFGYGCFTLFTLLLSPLLAYGYVVASLLANLSAIAFAFFGHKWFVFKSHGNYLKEWVHGLGVYSGGLILSAAALPFIVSLIRRRSGHDRSAPYIAGAVVIVFSIVVSFFGQRRISLTAHDDARQSTP
jgi:putative flippase GtrA